ncbi:hypothetical protein [Dactylosporangium matsuzakiense]|uniref:Uncharacterized protein n=1 Tax=Dactylosporangium matsuzakiense TaxID=53360 RepID=A0A9W6NMD5_9ACTN|nr:hypothetical protein [Dactylosporangium matsuzakiense]UWZ46344.1 hypothetical protein Dmats_07905 [Dactylosporangium matsuzakiense]GLL02053.1 hypothetical protein GCM10017581_037950 [Dactylosporangium matsuzakiense]
MKRGAERVALMVLKRSAEVSCPFAELEGRERPDAAHVREALELRSRTAR